MNRYLVVAALASVSCLSAQNANPISSDLKQMYTGVKNNLIRMAEKMPEEHYSFQPTPDIRTFGQLMGHVADSQARNCSAVTGEAKSVDGGKKTSKADLTAALKESFAICDAAFDALTDANAAQMIKTGRGERTKAAALAGTVSHSNEEYGYMAVYMRLKSLVPPSSERR
jgi:uncharacterized damage-inducible protein DinB